MIHVFIETVSAREVFTKILRKQEREGEKLLDWDGDTDDRGGGKGWTKTFNRGPLGGGGYNNSRFVKGSPLGFYIVNLKSSIYRHQYITC